MSSQPSPLTRAELVEWARAERARVRFESNSKLWRRAHHDDGVAIRSRAEQLRARALVTPTGRNTPRADVLVDSIFGRSGVSMYRADDWRDFLRYS